MFCITDYVCNVLQLTIRAKQSVPPADSAEDIHELCPDCPLLASLNDTDVLATVSTALNDYNSKTPDAYLRLLEIGRAIKQVTARTMSTLPCKQNIFSVILEQH